MRTQVKRTLVLLLALALHAQSFTGAIAYAQEATNSAEPAASPSAQTQTATATASAQAADTAVDTQNPFADTTPLNTPQKTPQQTLSSLLAASLGGTSQSLDSATVRQPAVIQKLLKHTFKADEPVEVTVSNATADDVRVSLTDWKGRTITNVFIDKQTVDTQTTITVNPPAFGFKPGKYTLHITDPDGKTSTQDFTWGVLAINLNKSIYTPNETAKIAMAVLDEQGNMVCNAAVTLQIANAALHINDTLSTGNGKITVNPQCESHAFSLTPDYEAQYQLAGVGQYDMTLTATTKNGTYTIDDGTQVVPAVPFDVERTTATRIYPPNKYPVTFHITANRDFTGTVTEYAPANFDIFPSATDSGTQTYDATSLQLPTVDTQTAFGVPLVSLAKPFSSTYPLEQGFGVKMTDPQEAPYYASFGLAGHDGLDFGLPYGTPVLAADDGTVALAGDGAYGTTVVIDHPWGRSYYGHLSKLAVKVGDKVTKGFEIALSGNSGHTTGPHLHFGIKPKNPNMQNGFYGKVDPSPYFTTSLLSSVSPLLSGEGQGEVLGISTSTINDTAMKVIRWNVSVKKGDTFDLVYAFKAPDISPQFYTLGPLTFTQDGIVAFQEQRQWQIAADVTTVVSNISTGWFHNHQRNIFYNGTNFFVFYTKGDSTIYYKAASTIANLANATETSIITMGGNIDWDIFMVNDTKFDVGYADTTTTAKVQTCTISGTTADCSTLKASAAASPGSTCTSVTVTRTPSANRVWLTLMCGNREVYSANQTGDSGTSSASNITSWTQEVTSGFMVGYTTSIPFHSSDEIIAISGINPGGTNNDGIETKTCTRAAGCSSDLYVFKGDWTTLGNNHLGNGFWVSDTDFRYIYVDNSATNNLIEAKFNGTSWSNLATIDNGGGQNNPALFHDSQTGDEYALFADSSSPSKIWRYYKPSGGAWGSKTEVDGSESTANSLPVTQMDDSPYGNSSNTETRVNPRELPWCYLNANGTNFNVICNDLTLPKINPTPTFMESGTDATHDFSFWSSNSTVGTGASYTSDTSLSVTGPRSIKFNTGGSSQSVYLKTSTGTLPSNAGRMSFYAYFTNFPNDDLIDFINAGYVTDAFGVNASHHFCTAGGVTCGSTTAQTGQWYHISLGYSITSTSVNEFKLYVNDKLEVDDVNATLNATNPTAVEFGFMTSGDGNNLAWNIDDIYIDNGSDLSDPGPIHITNKRPNANGSANNFSTSGTPAAGTYLGNGTTNHWSYVSEQPLNNNAGLSGLPNTSENFGVESCQQGDANICGAGFTADAAWLYASASGSLTGNITNNGSSTGTIALTTTNTLFTNFDTTKYPDNAATVGMVSPSSGTTFLGEAGMLIAYQGPTLAQTMHHRKWFSGNPSVLQPFAF